MSYKADDHPPNDSRLTLKTLGEASLSYVSADYGVMELLPAGKPLAMLVYLAHCPGRAASRDHLLELLWAEHETAAAKHAMRQAVWYIRKRVGSSPLDVSKGMARLTADLDVDAHRFLAAVEAGDLERAVELYDGPFMADVALPGGAEFEQWAYAERVRLESLLFRAADIVVHKYNSEGRFRQAERLARRLRDMAPFKEVGWRLLLEALVSSGDTVRATVEAAELEQMLEVDGRTPDRATLEVIRLARQLPANRSEPDGDRALIAELVGREREFATIISAWQQAQAGTGSHIAITAAAGLGKTRLLNDVSSRLRATGATVVHLRANHGERHVSYAFAGHLAKALAELPGAKGIAPGCAATLVALNPSLSSIYDVSGETMREDEARRRRIFALNELLAAVSHEQPAALQIDDLHWMDEASRNTVFGVAAASAGMPVLLITTARPFPKATGDEATGKHLTLPPLTEEQVGALVCSLGALPEIGISDRLPALLHETTDGSPLLVMETLRLALDAGTLELSDEGWSCPDEAALAAMLEEGSALKRRVARLERGDGWVLLLLSTAGMPLAVKRLAKMARRPPEVLDATLASLERRGLVSRVGEEYEPAHDEIAALSIETATPDARAAASAAVGRVIADDSWNNLQDLTIAGQFLAHARDSTRLESVFKRCVWLARSSGDRRGLRNIARDVLGQATDTREVAALVKSLPLYARVGLTSGRRVAAVLLVVALAATAATLSLSRRPSPDPDAVFVALQEAEGTGLVPVEIPIVRQDWDDVVGLRFRRAGAAGIQAIHDLRLHVSPDGSQMAFSRLMHDSGGVDVFVRNAAGEERRLTFSPGDDKPTGWSPDGSEILTTTARWHPFDVYEIGLLSVETGEYVRFTDTDLLEVEATWSPDGTRIAFRRIDETVGRSQICWKTVDGLSEQCMEFPDQSPEAVLGWRGIHEILVRVESSDTSWLASLNAETGTIDNITTRISETALSSPDGEWIACNCPDSLGEGLRWIVYPTTDPQHAKPIIHDAGVPNVFRPGWYIDRQPPTYLDSLAILPHNLVAPLGVPLSLRVAGYDAAGRRIPVNHVRWSVDDQRLAGIDSNGVLTGMSQGEITITADAAGWRLGRTRATVAPSQTRTVFTEDWSESWETRWRSFGDPLPVVVSDGDTLAAFLNNGDGSFNSGAYSEREWSVSDGFGVEAWVSARLESTPRHKRIYLQLVGWLETDSLLEWDHRFGHPPGRSTGRTIVSSSSLSYLGSPGTDEVRIEFRVAKEKPALAVPNSLRTTDWHLARLQVFPDGTCGVAIDGVALARSSSRINTHTPYRLMAYGNSIDAEMLVGPLEAWTGVRTDVDWTVLRDRQ